MRFSKTYKVSFNSTDTLAKTLVVDLLDLQDSNNLSSGLTTLTGDYGVGTNYKFPYQTIESVVVLDASTLVTINDNNYPFSVGRHVGNTSTTADDITDDNEMIVIKLDENHKLDALTASADQKVNVDNSTLMNYPNPFGNSTVLEFALTEASIASVSIQNTLGEELIHINLGELSSGRHSHTLSNLQVLSQGLYVVKLNTNTGEQSLKVIKTQ